jgi:hypothetical protein
MEASMRTTSAMLPSLSILATATSVIVSCLLLLGVASGPGEAATDSSPTEIRKNPDRFDNTVVTTLGKIRNLSERTSRKGNQYFTLCLDDGTTCLSVFSFGRSPCREGASATVEGTFRKVKTLPGGRTFYNEIETRPEQMRCR